MLRLFKQSQIYEFLVIVVETLATLPGVGWSYEHTCLTTDSFNINYVLNCYWNMFFYQNKPLSWS